MTGLAGYGLKQADSSGNLQFSSFQGLFDLATLPWARSIEAPTRLVQRSSFYISSHCTLL